MTQTSTSRHPLSASTIIRNVTSNWAGVIVNILLAFVMAPLTVRSLGNVQYGIWTLLMQLTGYLWLFDFGVRESVVKYVAQYHAADDRDGVTTTVRTAVSLYSVVTAATVAIAVSLAIALPYLFNIPGGDVSTARWTAILIGGTVAQAFVFNVFVGVVMGLQKIYLVARLGVFFALFRAAVVYLLLTNGFGVVALAAVQFSMTLINNLVIYRIARRELPYVSIRLVRPKREDVMRLVNYGKYVLVSNVGDKLVFASDSLVVGTMLPIASLTYYAIGGTLIENLRTFVTSMAAIFNPMTSDLEARRETQRLVTVVLTGTKAAMLIGAPVCIGFITLGSTFIRLWMGEQYAGPAGQILAVLAVGHLIGLPYYTISGVLYGLGRHRVVALSRIFEGVFNLALSIVLVKLLGLIGIALGTIIPQMIVVGIVLPMTLPRFVPVVLREYYVSTYVRPLLAAAPFALVCWYIARYLTPASFFSFFALIAIAIPFYLVPTWFVALTGEQRAAARSAIGQRLFRRAAIPGTV